MEIYSTHSVVGFAVWIFNASKIIDVTRYYKDISAGCSKMPRYKALEILRSEAY